MLSRTATAAAALAAAVALAVPLTTPADAAAPRPAVSATTPSTAPPVPTPPPISWGQCQQAPQLASKGARCGFVTVPLDYDRPGGRTIRLAVSRIAATSKRYQGVVLTNPGGPGGSGLGLSVLGGYVPGNVDADYDWVGFDPRGVGASEPSLSCDPDHVGYDRPPYEPTTTAIERYWLTETGDYAAACGRAQPELLRHMTTADSARDMESIRLALGAPQINYYGFSYGTYLGQVYGTLFPSRVRRMVLDSNVDPRRVWYAANLDQDVAFDRNIDVWFGWVARYDAVYHLGSTQQAVRDRWYGEKARLDARPAGGRIGPSEWTDLFLPAAYYQDTWPELADVFAGWVAKGQAAPLRKAYDEAVGVGDDNGYAVYLAVQCTDAAWPADFDTWRRDNWAVHRQAPFGTWGNAWYNAPCLRWPAPARTPVEVDGRAVAPSLLVGETLDAATPYSGSLEVRRRFPGSVLVGQPGGTSHAMTLSGNACVDDTIAAYLSNGTLPARLAGDGRADRVCQPSPQPVPAGAGTSTGTGSTTASSTTSRPAR